MYFLAKNIAFLGYLGLVGFNSFYITKYLFVSC
jgi:hypothetical protein